MFFSKKSKSVFSNKVLVIRHLVLIFDIISFLGRKEFLSRKLLYRKNNVEIRQEKIQVIKFRKRGHEQRRSAKEVSNG